MVVNDKLKKLQFTKNPIGESLSQMKNTLPSKSAWPNSVFYFLTIFLFILFVSLVGYTLIQQQKRFLLSDKQKEIATIADIKTSQLVQWRKERFAEGASIRANGMMSHRIKDYITGKGSSHDEVPLEFRRWMANLIDLGEYSKAILFSPAGGIITSDSELKSKPSQHYLDLVAEAAREHELILSDFHSDGPGDPFDLNLTVPIIDFDGARPKCIAVLVFDIDPTKRLYPLIQSWPTSSATAETLLVKREGDSVLFLNELRHRKNTDDRLLLPLIKTDMPAVQAVLGKEGNFEGVDYRNAPVLSATKIIPGTQWGMVAKIDTSEVLIPLSKSILYIVLSGVFVLLTMTMGIFLWSIRKRAENLRRVVEIQKNAEHELQLVHAGLEQQIQERTRDLSDINTLLRQEITEREQLEQKLLNAKRLEAIGQIASGVAHEVRNPLNAILTITEALFREEEIISNPEYEPYIQHIRSQVNRLAHLMNDLLDLGRTIPPTNLQPTPLFEICRETLDLWKSTGMSKIRDGRLAVDCDKISIQVLSDPGKLQQVFFNLLENAGHRTTDGTEIIMQLVQSKSNNGMAIIQVVDQGAGIPEDKLRNVFDPFYTDRKGGTGLGLALVKHFVENMGGSVQIWNNNPPPGCTAEVRIPLYREELK